MLWYFQPPLLEGTEGVTRGLPFQPLQVIVNQVISHCSPCLHLSCLQYQLPATWILIRGTYITFFIIIALHSSVSVSSSEIMFQGKEKEKSWQSQCLNSTEVCCWLVSGFSASQMAFLGCVSSRCLKGGRARPPQGTAVFTENTWKAAYHILSPGMDVVHTLLARTQIESLPY